MKTWISWYIARGEGINYSKTILMFHGQRKYFNMMHVLHLNSIILFKYNLLPSMWPTLQCFHSLESVCMAWYNEHGINIFQNMFLFHGLQYYHKMIRVLFSSYVLLRLCNTLPSFKRYVMEPKGFMGYLERGIACELNSFGQQHYPFDSLTKIILPMVFTGFLIGCFPRRFLYGYALPF